MHSATCGHISACVRPRLLPPPLSRPPPARVCMCVCTSTGTAGGASIWERITRHKAPVVEPRDSGAFAAALADYAAKLEDPNGNGAVLFAVCRGKVGSGVQAVALPVCLRVHLCAVRAPGAAAHAVLAGSPVVSTSCAAVPPVICCGSGSTHPCGVCVQYVCVLRPPLAGV